MHYQQLNSRSNTNFSSSSSNSRSSSKGAGHSMSPLMTRARSSSVTGFINTGNLNSKSLKKSARNSIEEDCSYPVAASGFDDNDLPVTVSTDLPNTYNIDWSDVNTLELDFVVYKTVPNIRKQLGPNEVLYIPVF